jgi:hypothetical protein
MPKFKFLRQDFVKWDDTNTERFTIAFHSNLRGDKKKFEYVQKNFVKWWNAIFTKWQIDTEYQHNFFTRSYDVQPFLKTKTQLFEIYYYKEEKDD